MSGTKEGWLKAKQTRIERLGSEEAFRKERAEMGRKGGKEGWTGGFYHMKHTDLERLRKISSEGGKRSRRAVRTTTE